eukprot:08876.XXX_429923_430075_1 [CDS] Oithona nana genome sequencing.
MTVANSIMFPSLHFMTTQVVFTVVGWQVHVLVEHQISILIAQIQQRFWTQ